MKVEVAAAQIHIEMIETADIPNVPTTTTYPSSWRLDFQHLVLSRTGANPGPTIDAIAGMIGAITSTTGETAKTIAETIEMIDVTLAVTATKEGTGVDRNSANERSEFCRKR